MRQLTKAVEIDVFTLNRLMHHGDAAKTVMMLKRLYRVLNLTLSELGEMAYWEGAGKKRKDYSHDAA